jgi:hypothetical protein
MLETKTTMTAVYLVQKIVRSVGRCTDTFADLRCSRSEYLMTSCPRQRRDSNGKQCNEYSDHNETCSQIRQFIEKDRGHEQEERSEARQKQAN